MRLFSSPVVITEDIEDMSGGHSHYSHQKDRYCVCSVGNIEQQADSYGNETLCQRLQPAVSSGKTKA